jgi:hypothetical protein|tara:strand:+ start:40 stop:501 length:462 start_codon:yes stop_codon:yes gene_type:complete
MAFIGNIFGAYAAKQLGKYNQDLFNLQARIDKRNAEIKLTTFKQVDEPRLKRHLKRVKSNLFVNLLKNGVDVDRIGETPYLVMLDQEVENAFELSIANYNANVSYQNEINRSLLTQAKGRAERYKGDLMFRTELAKAAGDIYANRKEYGSLLS